MNKFFGTAALIGLGFWWIFNFDRLHCLRARAAGCRLVASWERESDRGKTMANGKPHNPDKFTCASWDYPLGTILSITAKGQRRGIAVVCTDRGPHRRLLKTRQLDLSRAAFEALAPLDKGLLEVTVEVLQKHE